MDEEHTTQDGRLTRRTVIGAGAGVAAAGILGQPGIADAKKRKRRRKPRKADVIVIGAGLSGLTAARRIVARNKSVIVLEARSRIGGRLLNHGIGHGNVTELGGQFVGPTQDHILGLAQHLGVKTFPSYNKGNNLYYSGGTKFPFPSDTPFGSAPLPVAAEAAAAVAKLDTMSQQVPVDAPWKSPNATAWDSETLYTWLKNNSTTPQFMGVASAATEAIFGCEARDVSLLYTLFYIAASGNEENVGTFERNFNTGGGAQERRFVGGSQLIPLRMAKQLGHRHIWLETPARRIVQTRGGVRVVSDHDTFQAKRVIVAIPPPLAGRIIYEPKLSALRDQLTQRMPNGSLIKAEAVYDKPFWRDKGLTAQVVSDTGPVKVTFDNSPPDGSVGVLMGFIGGHEARTFTQKSKSQQRAAALQSFVNYFGEKARHPREFIIKNWSTEVWNRGCPVSVCPPGVLLDFGPALRAPQGRIHWAGTETSTYWNGYMDGAVRAGQRAAHEALAYV